MTDVIVVLSVLLVATSLLLVQHWRRDRALRRRLDVCHTEIEQLATRLALADELIGFIREGLVQMRRANSINHTTRRSM
jgi:hypothetical protein